MIGSGGSAARRLVLDTSAYSRMRGNDPRVLDLLAGADAVYLPAIVLGELDAGFRLGRREAENRIALDEFLAEPFVALLPVTPDVARHYARIFVELRRAATPIATNDIWIAATAIDARGHLLTLDGDYRHIASLDKTILPVP